MFEELFVAREHEMAQLQNQLNFMLEGKSQVCFITGEAGSGKTTLMQEFVRRTQLAHADLIAVLGTCDVRTGIGDPYLPFREVLTLLAGDQDSNLARNEISIVNRARLQKLGGWFSETLMEFGPDLAGLFIPGGSIAARIVKVGVTRSGWFNKLTDVQEEKPTTKKLELSQDAVYDQYSKILRELTKRQPLILILDDLQWADNASIGLLSHLINRIRGSRLFVIGTYRPDDVATMRDGKDHPLAAIVGEARGNFGEIVIDLDTRRSTEGRAFIDALLNTIPNRLDEAFRQNLFAHTSGHALFTVEILRSLHERSKLVMDEAGYWVTDPSLDWKNVPDRVQGVIAERIRELDEPLRKMLDIACIEGREFTAQVIAHFCQISEWQVLQDLARKLDQEYRLVEETGETRVDQTLLSHYQFNWALFQQYLYDSLSKAMRRLLHQQVGQALENLYGSQADEIAAKLALHYEQGKQTEKAVKYLRIAGERALRISALNEAQNLLKRALVLSHGATEIELPNHQHIEMHLTCSLGVTLWHLSEYCAAHEYLQESLALATQCKDTDGEAIALARLGRVLNDQGNFDEAIPFLQKSVTLARDDKNQPTLVLALRNLANVEFDKGNLDKAKQHYYESLALARIIQDQDGQSGALNNLGLIALQELDYAEAKKLFEEALVIDKQLGSRVGIAAITDNLGIVARKLGQYAEAQQWHKESLTLAREIGSMDAECYSLQGLGVVAREQGEFSQAIGHLSEAVTLAIRIGHIPLTLDILYEAAILMNCLGKTEFAINLLGFVLNHPSTVSGKKLEGEQILKKLSLQSSPSPGNETLVCAESIELNDMVTSVLDLLKISETQEQQKTINGLNR